MAPLLRDSDRGLRPRKISVTKKYKEVLIDSAW